MMAVLEDSLVLIRERDNNGVDLARPRPEKFCGIVVQVGIIRPGPIAGKRASAFIRRRHGRERVECLQPLLESAMSSDSPSPLRPMDPFERLETDYTVTGVNLGRHPMAYCRGEMDRRGVTPAARLPDLRDGIEVRVAGCVIVRQRPRTG